jgi:hypothetical protein
LTSWFCADRFARKANLDARLAMPIQSSATSGSATLQIYTDTDEQACGDALTRLHGLLDQPQH